MTALSRTSLKLVALFIIALLPALSQGQTTPQAPGNADAEMATLQTKMKVLKLQKDIDALTAQQKTLEKQLRTSPPAATTDAEMAAAQTQMKMLELQKKIAALKAQQAMLLNPSAPSAPAVSTTQAIPAKQLSPEDAEIQRLGEERQRLLKEQEIARLKKENEALKTPPTFPPAPATVAQAKPPAPSSKPDCIPASQKKPGMFDRVLKIADRQLDKAGKKIDKNTGGDGTQSSLPTATDITTADSPCPAGTVLAAQKQ